MTSHTKITNNETSQKVTKYDDRQEDLEIGNSCLRIGQINFEDKKNLKQRGHSSGERRVTEFQYSEESAMNDLDEEKENISECEIVMAEEAEDQGASLLFQDVAHQTENEQPAVEIEDLDKSEEFETCPKQAKSAIQLNQGKKNHLDETNSPDCKQFAVDDGECEEQDQRIGNGQDICGVSLKGPKQNALDLSAHSKKENQN